MGKPKSDPNARKNGESFFAWQHRLAEARAANENAGKPIVTPEAQRHGDYVKDFVTHTERNTKAFTFINTAPTIVEKWFKAGHAGFEEPAFKAIQDCIRIWERRKELGNLCAAYEQTIPSSEPNRDYGIMAALDDSRQIDDWQAMFHPAHWRVFENVVRWGNPAGTAARDLADNGPQSTASARAIVALVANVIAQRMGY